MRKAPSSPLGRRLFPPALLVLIAVVTAPGAFAQYDGLWKGRYGGYALDIQDQVATLLQASERFTWPLDVFGFDAGGGFNTTDGRRYQMVVREGRLELLDDRHTVFMSFVPVDHLPPLLSPTQDPVTVFDVFWEAFAENFALFDLVGVDWESDREQWRAQAAATTTGEQLYDLLTGLLEPLNDRHTTLVWPARGVQYRSGRDFDTFWQGRESQFLNNIDLGYLVGPMQAPRGDPRIRYGILPGEVGYLWVSNFLDTSGFWTFEESLDVAMAALANTRGLVVDLRFNPGGVGRNMVALLERVIAPRRQFGWVRERRLTGPLPSAFDEPTLQPLAPRDNPFHRRPMAVLTAPDTASAADAFLLALIGEPRVIQVGESPSGVFSSLLVREFPNGWYATLSHEQYHSLDGMSYEQKGVPPHLHVDRADYDFDQHVDPAIDTALAAMAAQPPHVQAPESPGLSVTGLWFDPERDGEGWHLQRVDADRVFVTFYTFDPDGSGRQDWVTGLGREEGGVLVIDELVTTSGGRFGAGSGAAPIETRYWGRGEIRFADCRSGVAELSGPDTHRGFTFRLQRLSRVPGLGCDAPGTVETPALSGSWYVPGRSGEGWLVSPIAPDQAVMSWFTFGEDGRRLWAIGTGNVDPDGTLVVDTAHVATGPGYGHDFSMGVRQLEPLGRLEFRLSGCHTADILVAPDGAPSLPPFAAHRLTRVEGLALPAPCE